MIKSIKPNTPGVYVVGAEAGPYKIGRSRDMASRVRAIQTSSPMPLLVQRVWPTDHQVRSEASLHDLLGAHRLHGEWFDCPLDAIDAAGFNLGLCDEFGAAALTARPSSLRPRPTFPAAKPDAVRTGSHLADALERALTETHVRMVAGASTRFELLARWAAEGRSARMQARAIYRLTVGSKAAPDGVKVTHVTVLNWQRARREAEHLAIAS